MFVEVHFTCTGCCFEVKAEADASTNDITECSHDDKPTVGMFGLSDVVFSAVICLSVTLCSH